MKSARLLDELVTGTQVEVIGVGKHYLRARLLDRLGIQPLDRRLGAHGHETRRVDDPVLGVQPARTGARLLAGMHYFKAHFSSLAPVFPAGTKKQLSPKEKNR